MEITIRKVEATDAAIVAKLSVQLGYPTTAEAMKDRIHALQRSDSDWAWVAVDRGDVVGWIQITQLSRLESGTFIEITGLVVDESRRNQGIGEQLVNYVRDHARQQGFHRMVVRSNVMRTQTHRFYMRMGFTEKKRQCVFDLDLKAD